MENYYEILGVAPQAAAEELKAAYTEKKLALMDRMQATDPAALQKAAADMGLLNTAYQTLNDPAARSAYDASLSAESDAGAGKIHLCQGADGPIYLEPKMANRPRHGHRQNGDAESFGGSLQRLGRAGLFRRHQRRRVRPGQGRHRPCKFGEKAPR